MCMAVGIVRVGVLCKSLIELGSALLRGCNETAE